MSGYFWVVSASCGCTRALVSTTTNPTRESALRQIDATDHDTLDVVTLAQYRDEIAPLWRGRCPHARAEATA